MDYTADYTESELLAHGKMRVLRMARNQHARRFREAIEGMHSELLHAIRGLDTESVHRPLNTVKLRKLYRAARQAEQHMLAIDEQRHFVGKEESST